MPLFAYVLSLGMSTFDSTGAYAAGGLARWARVLMTWSEMIGALKLSLSCISKLAKCIALYYYDYYYTINALEETTHNTQQQVNRGTVAKPISPQSDFLFSHMPCKSQSFRFFFSSLGNQFCKPNSAFSFLFLLSIK